MQVDLDPAHTGQLAVINPELTPELKREGLMREVVRYVQSARKSAGLNVDDRIVLHVTTDDEELAQAIAEHQAVITAETLAETFSTEPVKADVVSLFSSEVTVESRQLTIGIAKA